MEKRGSGQRAESRARTSQPGPAKSAKWSIGGQRSRLSDFWQSLLRAAKIAREMRHPAAALLPDPLMLQVAPVLAFGGDGQKALLQEHGTGFEKRESASV